MNSELQKRLDELKVEREAEREKLSKQRKEREAAFEAKRRETKIQTVMSQRRDFTRGDAELYVNSGLYEKQSNQPRAFGMPGAITMRRSPIWKLAGRKPENSRSLTLLSSNVGLCSWRVFAG
jgi:hypothetical protein